MGHFFYKAVDQAGIHLTGSIEAVDKRSAVTGLADKGHFVVELSEDAPASSQAKTQKAAPGLGSLLNFTSNRVSGKDILAMTNQFSAALRAGLPLLAALKILRDQQHKPVMKQMLDELVASVSSGESLSEAMANHKKIFSPLYLSMIRVGETGGILDETMGQLVSILDRDEKIKSSMRNASVYPLFVMAIGIVSVIIIIVGVVPKIINTMGDGAILPLPTRILLGMGNFLKSYGWLVVIALGAGFYYLKEWSQGRGRLQWDAFRLRIPILGSVLRTIAVGRFARTLGALTCGGVTILESLSIVRDTLGNELLAKEMDHVAEQVQTGSSVAEPLAASGHFPPLLVQIVSIGEQTGRLDELLLNAADTFDSEADSAITKFISIFPAVLIVLLALIIGFIIAATLMPIMMMQLGGGAL